LKRKTFSDDFSPDFLRQKSFFTSFPFSFSSLSTRDGQHEDTAEAAEAKRRRYTRGEATHVRILSSRETREQGGNSLTGRKYSLIIYSKKENGRNVVKINVLQSNK